MKLSIRLDKTKQRSLDGRLLFDLNLDYMSLKVTILVFRPYKQDSTLNRINPRTPRRRLPISVQHVWVFSQVLVSCRTCVTVTKRAAFMFSCVKFNRIGELLLPLVEVEASRLRRVPLLCSGSRFAGVFFCTHASNTCPVARTTANHEMSHKGDRSQTLAKP